MYVKWSSISSLSDDIRENRMRNISTLSNEVKRNISVDKYTVMCGHVETDIASASWTVSERDDSGAFVRYMRCQKCKDEEDKGNVS